MDAETLYSIVSSRKCSIEKKTAAVSAVKAEVKRSYVELDSVYRYFEALSIAVNTPDDYVLQAMSFSCLCHFVKRVITQNPEALRGPSEVVLPVIFDKLGDPKSSVRATAERVLEDYWMACGMETENAIREIGLMHPSNAVKCECLIFLTRRLQFHEGKFAFRPFTPVVVHLLLTKSQSVQEAARNLLVTFFTTAPARAKQDLYRELNKQEIDENIAARILKEIGLDVAYSAKSRVPSSDSHSHAPFSQNRSALPLGGAARPGFRSLSKPIPSSAPVRPVTSSGTDSTASSDSVSDIFSVSFVVDAPTYSVEKMDGENVQRIDDFRLQIENMLPAFEGKETEHNWGVREKHVQQLRAILRGNLATEHQDTLGWALKILSEGIGKGMMSLRTSLALNSMKLVKESFIKLQHVLDPCIDPYLSTLVRITSGTKKLTAQTAATVVDCMIVNTMLSSKYLNHVSIVMNEKIQQPRVYAAIWMRLILCVHHAHVSQLESINADSIMEKCIVKGLGDTNPSVRESMRTTFWTFHAVWPRKGDAVLNSLDNTTRKNLERANKSLKVVSSGISSAPVARVTLKSATPSIREFIAKSRRESMQRQTANQGQQQQSLEDGLGSQVSSDMVEKSELERRVSDSTNAESRTLAPVPHHDSLDISVQPKKADAISEKRTNDEEHDIPTELENQAQFSRDEVQEDFKKAFDSAERSTLLNDRPPNNADSGHKNEDSRMEGLERDSEKIINVEAANEYDEGTINSTNIDQTTSEEPIIPLPAETSSNQSDIVIAKEENGSLSYGEAVIERLRRNNSDVIQLGSVSDIIRVAYENLEEDEFVALTENESLYGSYTYKVGDAIIEILIDATNRDGLEKPTSVGRCITILGDILSSESEISPEVKQKLSDCASVLEEWGYDDLFQEMTSMLQQFSHEESPENDDVLQRDGEKDQIDHHQGSFNESAQDEAEVATEGSGSGVITQAHLETTSRDGDVSGQGYLDRGSTSGLETESFVALKEASTPEKEDSREIMDEEQLVTTPPELNASSMSELQEKVTSKLTIFEDPEDATFSTPTKNSTGSGDSQPSWYGVEIKKENCQSPLPRADTEASALFDRLLIDLHNKTIDSHGFRKLLMIVKGVKMQKQDSPAYEVWRKEQRLPQLRAHLFEYLGSKDLTETQKNLGLLQLSQLLTLEGDAFIGMERTILKLLLDIRHTTQSTFIELGALAETRNQLVELSLSNEVSRLRLLTSLLDAMHDSGKSHDMRLFLISTLVDVLDEDKMRPENIQDKLESPMSYVIKDYIGDANVAVRRDTYRAIIKLRNIARRDAMSLQLFEKAIFNSMSTGQRQLVERMGTDNH